MQCSHRASVSDGRRKQEAGTRCRVMMHMEGHVVMSDFKAWSPLEQPQREKRQFTCTVNKYVVFPLVNHLIPLRVKILNRQ